jgi:hypothetical protein
VQNGSRAAAGEQGADCAAVDACRMDCRGGCGAGACTGNGDDGCTIGGVGIGTTAARILLGHGGLATGGAGLLLLLGAVAGSCTSGVGGAKAKASDSWRATESGLALGDT